MTHWPLLTNAFARALSLLIAALAALSGCSREIGREGERGAVALATPLHAAEPMPAAVAPASSEPVPAPVEDSLREWSSVLHSEHDVEVATRVPGMVATVAVELGDRVRAGQLLVTLRDEEEQATLEAARPALELARLEHERASTLGEQNMIAQAEVDLATYALHAAEAVLREAEVRLEYTRIRAPFDGAVSRRFVRVGQSLEEREPIVRVTALRPLRSLIRVPEVAALTLAPGQSVRLRGLAGETVEGRISRIAPAVDPVSGTVEVLIEVPEPGSLRPGAAVTIALMDIAAARP